VEHVELVTGAEPHCIAKGRSATALLHQRTIEGTEVWSATKHGAIVKDIIDGFTGDRAIAGLSFGTGDTLGTAIDLQHSWGDAGEVVLEVLAAGNLGMTATLTGTDIVLDVFAPTDNGTLLGEKYRNASSGAVVRQTGDWRNYAIVLGEDPDLVPVTPSATNIAAGSSVSGSASDLAARGTALWTLGENASTGLTLDCTFGTVPADAEPGEFVVVGAYQGTSTHWIEAHAWNYGTGAYEKLRDLFICSGGLNGDEWRVPFAMRHIDTTNGECKLRLVHNSATYNNAHRLVLDYVACEYQPARTRVDVDDTGTDELRELYVDARDLQKTAHGVTLSDVDYAAVLTQRGYEKLSETRIVEYAEADTDAELSPGAVCWYDNRVWSGSLMVTEAKTTREGGHVLQTATLGEPPLSLRRLIRKEGTR
jgi:hypothetical protein